MNLTERVQAVVAEIGPLRDYAAVAAYPKEGLWRVLVDETLIVEIELDEGNGLLILSGSAGEVPAGRDVAALHAMMLDYGAIWRQTGGIQIARDADGSILIVKRVAAAGLDRTALANHVDRFAETLRAWSAIVANPIAAMAERQGEPDPAMMAGFIRG